MSDKGKRKLSIGSSSGSNGGNDRQLPPKASGSNSKASKCRIDDAPLWGHVTREGIYGGADGNTHFRCHFFQRSYVGSYTRVRAHLLKLPNNGVQLCEKVDESLLKELRKKEEEYEKKKNQRSEDAVDILIFGGYKEDAAKKMGVGAIQRSFNLVGREEMNRKVGRFFFCSSIPFNVARNPYWKDLITSLANCNLNGYVPPTSEKLRTIVLAEEKGNIEKLLQHRKFCWDTNGVSIVSDGWTDIQRRPLINFIAYSINGPIFLKCVDTSGKVKSASLLKELFLEVIRNVGPDKVVQIITDNASNCKSAGLSLESDYPHIFWTPCVAHSLNLALARICKPSDLEKDNVHAYELCSWIENIAVDCGKIRNFVMNHHLLVAMFNRHSELKLLKVAETRFASLIVMVKRFKQIKKSLVQLVTDDSWDSFRASKPDDQLKAQGVKTIILDDLWWDKVSYFLDFTEPIWEMLREVDKDEPMLHRVYEMWDNMIEKVKSIILKHEGKDEYERSDFFEHIHSILVSRWNNSNTPLHCLAHSLNTKYYGKKWLEEGVGRVPLNQDQKISKHRQICFGRIFRDSNQLRQASSEFGKFSNGRLDCLEALIARDHQDPLDWWVCYGSETPILQKLALKLLSQPATSSCCERNWSTHSQIHNIKRNNLFSSRAEDLVYVHSNLRLLSRSSQEYSGPSKFWDAYPEDCDLEDDSDLQTLNMEYSDPVVLSTSSSTNDVDCGSMME